MSPVNKIFISHSSTDLEKARTLFEAGIKSAFKVLGEIQHFEIKQARKEVGIRQQYMANLLQINRSNYSRKESGKVSFRPEEKMKLINAINEELKRSKTPVGKSAICLEIAHKINQNYDFQPVCPNHHDTKFDLKNENLPLTQSPRLKRYLNIINDAIKNDDIELAYLALKKALKLIESKAKGTTIIMDGLNDAEETDK